MQATITREIERATIEVFTAMIGVELVPERHLHRGYCVEQSSLVSSLILSGSVEGAATLSCTLPMAARITCHMLELAPPLDIAEVLDALGEVANMICGNIKSSLETRWGSINIGTPTVGSQADTPSCPVSMGARFRSRDELVTISVTLQPAIVQRNQCSGPGRFS